MNERIRPAPSGPVQFKVDLTLQFFGLGFEKIGLGQCEIRMIE